MSASETTARYGAPFHREDMHGRTRSPPFHREDMHGRTHRSSEVCSTRSSCVWHSLRLARRSTRHGHGSSGIQCT
eukprot:6228009-Prymnesium_polylepis.2